MKIELVPIGGPFIWHTLCLLEVLSSIVSMEMDSVRRLTEHIQRIREYLRNYGSESNLSSLPHGPQSENEKEQLESRLTFFKGLKANKLEVINHLKNLEFNFKQQMSAVIQHQPELNL